MTLNFPPESLSIKTKSLYCRWQVPHCCDICLVMWRAVILGLNNHLSHVMTVDNSVGVWLCKVDSCCYLLFWQLTFCFVLWRQCGVRGKCTVKVGWWVIELANPSCSGLIFLWGLCEWERVSLYNWATVQKEGANKNNLSSHPCCYFFLFF